LLYKRFSYFVLAGALFLPLYFTSCKTSASGISGSGRKKELSEQQKIALENAFIDACSDKNVKGKPEEAEKKLRFCLTIDPQNAAVKYELSKLLILTARLDEALQLAKESTESDPKNEWYHLNYIDVLNARRDYNHAAEAYEKLVKIFPERSEYVESMAIEYAMGQNYAKAFKIYEELEKRFGENETFTLNKVKLLKEQKKYNEAENELKRMINTNPQEPRYHVYLAEFYEDMNDLQKAKTVYEKLLEIDPNNAMVHLIMANYYKEQGRSEESHNERKIAFSNPDLPLAAKTEILAWYLQQSAYYPEYTEKGFELCEIMVKVHPKAPEAHGIYATFLMKEKKYEQAYTHFLMAARYDRNHLSTWLGLMEVEVRLQKYDSLEMHSASAMELFPSQPIPYFYNGVANKQMRNYKKAAQSFYDGVEFVYDDKGLMLDFYTNLGDVYAYLEEYEKSDKAYDDALKINPDQPYVLNNYAYYLSMRKEKLDKAEKLSKRANDLDRENPEYIDTYGWILFQLGKYKEAEDWLSRAIKMKPNKAVFSEHYGDVMYKLDKPEDALKYWKRANELGGNSDKLLKKISTKKISEQ
jgi:tetratricopeptide (TPR) repeat protein